MTNTPWTSHRKLTDYRRWLLDNRQFIINSTQPVSRPYMAKRIDGQLYDVTVMLKQLEKVMTIAFDGNIENLLLNTATEYQIKTELRWK